LRPMLDHYLKNDLELPGAPSEADIHEKPSTKSGKTKTDVK
jgi:hypothetical protein